MKEYKEMSTPRLRSYVKDNAERVEEWTRSVIKGFLVNKLSEKYGNDETPSTKISAYDIVKNAGQIKIFMDIMEDNELCYEGSYSSKNNYRKILVLWCGEESFEKELDLYGESEPQFNTSGDSKVHEYDVYTHLSNLSIKELIYVYRHQDEFRFMNIWDKQYKSFAKGLGVLSNKIADEADNLSFRNQLNSTFSDLMGMVSEMLYGHQAPQLDRMKTDWGNENSPVNHALVTIHKEMLPRHKSDMNLMVLNDLVEKATFQVDVLQKTLEQLKDLRDSMVESGGDETFEEFYYERMIEEFYRRLPLFINSENDSLKGLADRAARKKYY